MDLSGLDAVANASDMITWLTDNAVTPVRPRMSGSDIGTILHKIISVLGSMVPVSDASSGEVSKSYLNTTYPNALAGQVVLVDAAGVMYTKLDNSPTGNWLFSPYNLTA